MSELWRRLRMLLRRDRFDRELEEEMRLHIEMQAGENCDAGMDAKEARYAAMCQFGNELMLKEKSRETWGWGWLEQLSQDLRYALRTLGKNPGFTAVAVLTLALGIGANTAIFGLLEASLLRPLPVHNPQRLVQLRWRAPRKPGGISANFSYPLFTMLQNGSREHADLLATAGVSAGRLRVGNGESEPITKEIVSSGYFTTLGVEAAGGRLFQGDDDRLSHDGAQAVISYGFWLRRFGGDPSVTGR